MTARMFRPALGAAVLLHLLLPGAIADDGSLVQPGPADCMVIDTSIPDGQKTRNEILLILHQEGGGDFLASSGRSLGAPGHERTFVPLSQFHFADWSHDADNVLDPTRISDVSIGWGGYLGTEGEEVRFQVASPRIGTVGPERIPPGHQPAIPGVAHP